MARATASGIAGLLAQQPQRPSARASRDQFGEIRAVDSDGTVTFEVRLDGAEGFAPCTCTCEVHHGDRVLCHIVNHRIVVFSNVTSPSINDDEYPHVKNIAEEANEILDGMAQIADAADKTLDDIVADSIAASQLLDGVEDVAEQADKTLAEIIQDAEAAGTSAAEAKTMAEAASLSAERAGASAAEANSHANDALRQVSVVQDVVDVVTWIAEHSVQTEDTEIIPDKKYYENDGGTLVLKPNEELEESYALTDDTSVVSGKTYYTRSGSGTEESPYVYTEVENPSAAALGTYYEKGNPALLGMYELSEAVRDYLAAHLAMTADGLLLTADGQKYRAMLGTDGLIISDHEGKIVGKHGETIQLGSTDGVYFEASPNKLSFRTLSQEIAYFGLNANGIWEMHIANTYADEMIRFGDYAWIKRSNGNMSIKWLGE